MRLDLETLRLPETMRDDLRVALETLIRHHASRVVLYGSAARGDWRADSDLDLCVEGLPGADFFQALAECLMTSVGPVSVVDWQNTRGYFRERIEREGKVLYDGM